MVFNSAAFAIFFVIVYTLYLAFQKNFKLQNRLLCVASCVFYGWWDWRFLFLMLFTITVDFFVGKSLYQTEGLRKKKLFLTVSVLSNLSILGFFKYFNFFMESFDKLFNVFGFTADTPLLNIILPVGISFYTFQSMSYVVDVYRGQLKPAHHLLDYAAYVSYFPQLVAGPIERGVHLLPQIIRPRSMNLEKFYEGCYLIFWGLYQKMFVADNLAGIVDPVFASPGPYNGAMVLLAIYAFSFQIFCDFSGYSDIARGLGKCMGFNIMVNFNLPYFSTNPSEFWRRWHISLSSWLRDYLYIPLGGSKKGRLFTVRNLAITMLLGGLWHGARWTFVIWGAYHGLLLILHRLARPLFEFLPKINNQSLQNIWRACKIIFFFHLVCLGWLFFRAESFTQISEMLYGLLFEFRIGRGYGLGASYTLVYLTSLLLLVQCFQYIKGDLTVMLRAPVVLRAVFYVICFYSLAIFGVTGAKEFIYFQF